MNTTLTQKSILARLLAKENIEVVQGNFPTAFFDVEKRILGLPSFKEGLGKDLLDLLVGHEVGHAKYTPKDGWHDAKDDYPNIPRSFINIVEDIRIEKKILDEYPGLLGGFKRGYKELLDRNFFGIDGQDLSELNFIDRLNLASKSRGLLDISFTDEEMPYYKMAMGVETFDDVISTCTALVSWLGTKTQNQEVEQEIDLPENAMTDGSNPDNQVELPSPSSNPMGDEEESDEGEEKSPSGSSPSNEQGEEENDSNPEQNSASTETEQSSEPGNDEDAQTEESSAAPGHKGGKTSDNLESKTDETFRNKEKELVNDLSRSGDGFMVVEGMTRAQFENLKVPFAVQKAARDRELIRLNEIGYTGAVFDQPKFDSWMKEAKGQVSILAKEFEMRKAAYRSLRARSSTKGTLDVTKLHKYKYDDQLFKQITKLADSKSHGMIMFIDFSGSMSRVIDAVMKQTLILSMFCDRVGIPYQVYSFTDAGGEHAAKIRDTWASREFQTRTRLETDMQLCELLSSTMSKKDKEDAIKFMFNIWRHLRYQGTAYDSMRGTPLNLTFMAAHYICADFQAKHNVQKLNLTFLTDGMSDRLYTRAGLDMELVRKQHGNVSYEYANRIALDFYGKIFKTNISTRDLNDPAHPQLALCKSLKDNFGCEIINYFLADSSATFRSEIYMSEGTWDQKLVTSARKNGAFVADNVQGYTRRLIVEARGEIFGWDNDSDLEVDNSMTASQIATAFKKQANGKSKKRFICQKFAEMVA